MSYEVRFLTKEEEEEYYGWESDGYSSSLGIFIDDVLSQVHNDGGEPEDNSFGRDWSWVPQALKAAYQKGLEDGKK